jgi:hypothetical protein
VWVRGGLTRVQLFYEGELVKSHRRSYTQGKWMTDETDYPPEKSKYLLKTLSYYQQQALQYGEFVGELVTKIMTEHAYRNLRKVQGIFRLAQKYGSEAMNLTAERCLFYEDYRMTTIKRILDKQLYGLPLEETTTQQVQVTSSFVRPCDYFNHTKEERT